MVQTEGLHLLHAYESLSRSLHVVPFAARTTSIVVGGKGEKCHSP